jgi:hypothetical protein
MCDICLGKVHVANMRVERFIWITWIVINVPVRETLYHFLLQPNEVRWLLVSSNWTGFLASCKECISLNTCNTSTAQGIRCFYSSVVAKFIWTFTFLQCQGARGRCEPFLNFWTQDKSPPETWHIIRVQKSKMLIINSMKYEIICPSIKICLPVLGPWYKQNWTCWILTLEDGADRLSRNVSNKLQLLIM